MPTVAIATHQSQTAELGGFQNLRGQLTTTFTLSITVEPPATEVGNVVGQIQ